MTLAERLRHSLAHDHRGVILLESDSGDAALGAGETLIAAAVLVPIVDHADPTLILTRRNDRLRAHAGQIAFPGGRVDPDDDGAVATALREAYEEIGLDPAMVDVVGPLDRYRTVTGYEVTPVIGVVPPGLTLTPHDAEVAETFEVPLSFVLDSANHVEQAVEWQGRERRYFEIVCGERRIWGATAAMIINIARRLA